MQHTNLYGTVFLVLMTAFLKVFRCLSNYGARYSYNYSDARYASKSNNPTDLKKKLLQMILDKNFWTEKLGEYFNSCDDFRPGQVRPSACF